MSGLVERLRAYAKDQGGWHNIDDTCDEAASEIERLTAANNALTANVIDLQDSLIAALATARNDALEEAAKASEARGDLYVEAAIKHDGTPQGDSFTMRSGAAQSIADAIRALKGGAA